jgi:CRISPR-associated endonuclease/helicase Cas3
MNDVELPALDGRSALGFFAALGLLRLLEENDIEARLSWSSLTGTAVLHTELASVGEIVACVQGIVDSLRDDQVIPGAPVDLPCKKVGSAPDPMRVRREDFRALVAEIASDPGEIGVAERWIGSLLTDLAVDRAGRAAITPYSAPSGQQSLRTMFEKPLELLRSDPELVVEALTAWSRRDGYTGEYLDHRAIRNAADDPLGDETPYAVPGATWLVLMSLPLLRVSGDGTSVLATAWQRAGREQVLVWPLWRPALDTDAVICLLEHPALAIAPDNGALRADLARIEPLGVFAVYAAARRQLPRRKSAGVLAPRRVVAHA